MLAPCFCALPKPDVLISRSESLDPPILVAGGSRGSPLGAGGGSVPEAGAAVGAAAVVAAVAAVAGVAVLARPGIVRVR